ncbi:MAG: flippase-like domain-containing protein [Anaerolineae bacterium]|nr:flippase-like domain-containing protein [Anaerolineae bacterium]
MQKYRNQILTGLGFGFIVVIAIILLNDVRALADAAMAFPWALMLLPLALRVTNWALRFIKWHYYLHVVGVHDFAPVDSAALFVSGFTLSVSPGKAAELLKSFVLKNMTGAPVTETMPVVAAERLSDGVAVLLLAAISIVALAAGEFWPVILASAAALTAGLVVLQYRPLSLWLLDQLIKLPLVRRFAEPVRALYESSYALFRLKPLVIAAALGAVANFTDGIGVYLILLGVGCPPSQELFFQALLIISLSVVAGSLSGLPGGLGAADLSIGFLMQRLVGLDAAAAAFVTLVARFVQLWFGVIVGMGVAFVFRRRLFPPSLAQVIAAAEAHHGDMENAG